MKPTKKPFENLTDEVKQPYLDQAANLLDGLLWCDRDWSAWGWGTMSSNDFHDAAGDDDLVCTVAASLYEFRLSLETRTQEELAFEQYKYGACESCEATDVYLTAYGHQRDGLQYVCPQCFLNYELDHRRMPELKDMQSAFPHYGAVQNMSQRDLEKNLKFMENYGTKNPTRESYIITPEKAQEITDAFHQNFKSIVDSDVFRVESGELSDRGKPVPPSPEYYENLWEEFRAIPVEADELQEPFLHFERGDSRIDVWAWFDDKYDGGCHALLYGKPVPESPVLSIQSDKVPCPLKGSESAAIIDGTSQPDKGNDSE